MKSKAKDARRIDLAPPEVFGLRLAKEGEATAKKWSPTTTMLFTIATCGSFWLILGYYLVN